ncbi:MAG: histidinol-phosphate transaminase [Bacillota bacterium]
MAYQLIRKLRNLTPYDPISGDYKIRLDANESYFTLSEEEMATISEEIAKIPLNRYPDPTCSALTEKYASAYQINPDFVTVGNGSDELISVICGSFLENGMKILVVTPEFSMYKFYGVIAGCDIISIEKDEDMCVRTDDVSNYLKNNKIDMVIFSNPCNPTSVGLKKEDVRKIITASDALVVLDEAYMDFWDQSLLSEVEKYDNLIILKTSSKAVGLAGIRLGFAIANKTITTALRSAKSPYNMDAITQKIGEVIYSNPESLKEKTAEIISETKLLYQEIITLAKNSDKIEKVYKTQTNFVFIKTDFATEIFEKLKEESIVVRNFKKYLRITCGTKEENKQLLSQLKIIL